MESTDRLLAGMFGSAAMERAFSDRARLQGMLDFEAALAHASAEVGIVPPATAEAITRACQASHFDIDALSAEAVQSGNPAIPLIAHLRKRIAAEGDGDAARWAHFGATSQDAMDTGLVLQMREGLRLLDEGLARLTGIAADLTERHRHTLVVGRTWMQQALPITFGLRTAGWLEALERHRARLRHLGPGVLVLQFGGAAGTLAGLGKEGLKVGEALARELDLALPPLPWHTHRDRLVEAGNALAMLVGTLGKIARDVSLGMQTEVGEVFEPSGHDAGGVRRGGSSSMPHKRNPVASAAVLTAAVRAPGLVATLLSAMGQEHERGLGNWPAEWSALPDLFRLAAGALEQSTTLLEGLEVDPARMRANLEATGGLILAEAVKSALAPKLAQQLTIAPGAPSAQALVEEACQTALAEKRHLRDVLGEIPAVAEAMEPEALARLFDPAGYLGMSDAFIDRVLAARKAKP